MEVGDIPLTLPIAQVTQAWWTAVESYSACSCSAFFSSTRSGIKLNLTLLMSELFDRVLQFVQLVYSL